MKAVILILLALPGLANAATLIYEIFDFTENDKGALVASGTKSYTPDEIFVDERTDNPEDVWWMKVLWLEKGFGVGASIHRESELTGFGLTGELICKRYRCPFSWEWFYQSEGNHFTKLQESGRVKIEALQVDSEVEISKIVFLSDVSLRINANREIIGAVTHRIIIKKGSVLEYAP